MGLGDVGEVMEKVSRGGSEVGVVFSETRVRVGSEHVLNGLALLDLEVHEVKNLLGLLDSLGRVVRRGLRVEGGLVLGDG